MLLDPPGYFGLVQLPRCRKIGQNVTRVPNLLIRDTIAVGFQSSKEYIVDQS